MDASVFKEIYDKSLWGVGSGGGADPANLGTYLPYLQNFITQKRICSIVDVGCGDWQYMSRVDLTAVRYLGIDCVPSVIEANRVKYAKENVAFQCGDFLTLDLPSADLLICKDVLQHTSNQDILSFLPQLRKFKHCLLINDVGGNRREIAGVDRNYAGLDLQAPPFSLKGEVVLELLVCCVTKRVLHVTQAGV